MDSYSDYSDASDSEIVNSESNFKFSDKSKYDGFVGYLQTKSSKFEPKYEPVVRTVWDIKAPDFRHQSYVPKPPKRTTIYSQKPWKYGTYPGFAEPKPIPQIPPPHPILRPKPSSLPEFKRRFRRELSIDNDVSFVKSGKLPQESPYTNPQPHQFRQLVPLEDLGLPEFDAKDERDPGDIKLHHRFIRTIPGGIPSLPSNSRWAPGGPRMHLVRPSDPLFEPDLVLVKDRWPKGMRQRHSAEYTRHKKIIRTAQSAFMERAEHSLANQWERRKHGLPPHQPTTVIPPPPQGLGLVKC